MIPECLPTDDKAWHQYILNHCTKYLARANFEADYNYFFKDQNEPDRPIELNYGTHNYFSTEPFKTDKANSPGSNVCEAWRFPIIDSYLDLGGDHKASYRLSKVSFVYHANTLVKPQNVAVIGTFARLYEPIPLVQVCFEGQATDYFAITVVVPKNQLHRYKFLVDGYYVTDPINPHSVELDNGQTWSQFFTQLYSTPLVLERWEFILLRGLASHILPFRTREAQSLLNELGSGNPRQPQDVLTYHLNQEVGAVNFIDKLLAKEENYRLVDYRLCLTEIKKYFNLTNPETDLVDISEKQYETLFNLMADSNQEDPGRYKTIIPYWDYSKYKNPLFFLQLFRRHVFTAAFSHPKYGGNIEARGLEYLEETMRPKNPKNSAFDWRRALEMPLGKASSYRG